MSSALFMHKTNARLLTLSLSTARLLSSLATITSGWLLCDGHLTNNRLTMVAAQAWTPLWPSFMDVIFVAHSSKHKLHRRASAPPIADFMILLSSALSTHIHPEMITMFASVNEREGRKQGRRRRKELQSGEDGRRIDHTPTGSRMLPPWSFLLFSLFLVIEAPRSLFFPSPARMASPSNGSGSFQMMLRLLHGALVLVPELVFSRSTPCPRPHDQPSPLQSALVPSLRCSEGCGGSFSMMLRLRHSLPDDAPALVMMPSNLFFQPFPPLPFIFMLK